MTSGMPKVIATGSWAGGTRAIIAVAVTLLAATAMA